VKILFILEYYHPHVGGVETLFKNLIERLGLGGHDITVLTNQYQGTLPKLEKQNSITIKRLPFKNRYLFTFLSIYSAVRLAKRHDIIHTTSYNAAIPSYFASKLTGTKALITFHEVWGKLWFRLPWISFPSRILHYTFEQAILKMNFDQFIAVSDYTRKALINHNVDSNKVRRIYNGIDYAEFEKRKNLKNLSVPTFLYFGRVGISKGIDIILKAVEILIRETQNFKIRMILPEKQDSLTKRVVEIVKSKKLHNHIFIESSISFSQLKKTIAQVNAVIVPSYSEGFCFSAVETMAIGTPLIISGEGALSEVIGGKHLQFENMDPVSLKEKLVDAINDQWQETPVKKFELEESVQSYLSLYNEMQK
tara:strand:+ start:3502 stop:4596 length:1095 start_codon:yes stop_codon:yes gene_type:complete